MVVQIAVGTVLIILSVGVAAIGFWLLEISLERAQNWFTREPHVPKLMVMIAGAVLAVLWMITAGVWIWALAYLGLGIFATLEEALYFSLVAFTTLGFGDVLLPVEWRLLSGMTATNGFLNIGMMTALLMEVVRHVRRTQLQARLHERHEADAVPPLFVHEQEGGPKPPE